MSDSIEIIDTKEEMIYGDVAVHCTKCDGISPIPSEDFKKYQTGMFLRLQDKFVLHCDQCGNTMSLLFIPSKDVEEVEEVKFEEVVTE
jgi:hypothetical protein